ncbi:dual oxidase maturation factor 1 isoform X1 [Plodia interpunctella]|uniref:dual oxidase maturation factor 1 isoform X1 n=1 Tax=Plodia interpunctella TaxID=58824 RepID=UPI0023684F17|nr:dual oxidase maturation factor 1 isoform X1 [Plodia interpunctella]XP_053610056.1 dual oxidase maturation factor 1 isoform X1 [Plodia interpunctella]
MKGWFDAFREEGGPTLYAYHNRTAVAADVPALALVVAALTLYLAFLAIFPGIRKERFSTFTIVTLSLFVGTVILVCKHGSSWHVSGARVARASYRAFSTERLDCWLSVHVGLGHVNVTLNALSWGNTTVGDPGVDYNEQFRWEEAGAIQEWYRAGLSRGLPYPVLSIAEHFAVQHEGFEWGAKYRAAGYTTSTLLWTALALWLLMNLLLVVVPRYGAYAMATLGTTLCAAAGGYWASLPTAPLVVRLDGAMLFFSLGWCFWLVLIAGGTCVVVGLLIAALDLMWPHKFSTVLEVDYDTPYDRHVLIVDSSRQRARPPQPSLPTRILRRLSSKTRDMGNVSMSVVNESDRGRDNPAFQHERKPNSPWRYPLFRRQIDRVDSASSLGSSINGNNSGIKMSPLGNSTLGAAPSIPIHRFRPQIPAAERVKDMW